MLACRLVGSVIPRVVEDETETIRGPGTLDLVMDLLLARIVKGAVFITSVHDDHRLFLCICFIAAQAEKLYTVGTF